MKRLKNRFGRASAVVALICFAISACVFLSLGAFAAENNEIYLSDMDYVSEKHGWGSLMLDRGLDGKAIKIGNTTYAKGLVIHADSSIVYDISQTDCQLFTAYIGVNDSEAQEVYKKSPSMIFEVQIDGITVYKSDVFRYDTPALKIEIDIPMNAQTLTLITDDAGDGNKADHCAWAEARLVKRKLASGNLASIELAPSELVLKSVGDSAPTSFAALSVGGAPIDRSALDVTYSSSDSEVATVSGDGRVTLHSCGTAVITVTAAHTFDGVTTRRSDSITVLGGMEESKIISQTLTSPDGELAVNITGDAGGRLFFGVTDGGATLLEKSAIGIKTNLCDFSHGLAYVKSEKGEIDETYENISGSYSQVRNHANTLTATFEKGEFYFTLEFRAYDDGFAYRYTLERKSGSQVAMTVEGESGYFALPAGSKVFAEEIISISSNFNYQDPYTETKIEDCALAYWAFPLLSTADDEHWLLLSEAELYGDTYVGSALYGSGDNRLSLCFAPRVSSTEVSTKLSFTSPWRCGIAGAIGDIVESSLIENVSERGNGDFSWVKPGVTSWLWLSEGGSASRNFELLKKYVDLTAEMEWEYILLDAGWQPNAPYGYYEWFPEFMEYATERGVGVHVWVDCAHLDTEEEREVLKKWANDGIVGVKVDYFNSEDAARIALYEDIYDACAEARLILNLHGSNKPTGERQRWPHVINREGVLGEEKNRYDPSDLATYAYTRGVLGPMDITPRIVPGGAKTTTTAAQLAMCVHFESGTLTMASFASDYYNSPAKEFFRALPTAWDELRFIEGYPGDYSILARRSGENWYISGLSAEQVSATVALDFLDDGGSYMAYLYLDSAKKEDVTLLEFDVTSADGLDVTMGAGGGFAVKIVRLDSDIDAGGDTDGSGEETPTTPPTGNPEKPTDCSDEGYVTRVVVICSVSVAAVALGAVGAVIYLRKKKKTK